MTKKGASIKHLRGKHRGQLNSSDEFSQRKQNEKKLERCFTKKSLRLRASASIFDKPKL
jgi:hypothetical protein